MNTPAFSIDVVREPHAMSAVTVSIIVAAVVLVIAPVDIAAAVTSGATIAITSNPTIMLVPMTIFPSFVLHL